MVRDIESLIEYLYLKSLDIIVGDEVIVNPTESDIVIGKICIINKNYEVPDLTGCSKIVYRFESDKPYVNNVNPFIDKLNIVDDELLVFPADDKTFVFSEVPDHLLSDPCFQYLQIQLSKIDLPKFTDFPRVLKP